MLSTSLLAIDFNVGQVGFWLAVGAVFAGVVVFMMVTLLASRFKRCPSNRVLVIYGKAGRGEAAKCIHGGAKFVWPLIQDYAYLSLEPIQIEIPLRGAQQPRSTAPRPRPPSLQGASALETRETLAATSDRRCGSSPPGARGRRCSTRTVAA